MQLDLPFRDDDHTDRAGVPVPSDPLKPPHRARPLPPAVEPDGDPQPTIVFVRRRRARRYILRVDEHGAVRVTIPRGGSRRDALDFVARHRGWIAGQRARTPPTAIPAHERAGLQARARAELPARLMELAQEHGLRVARVSIRDQRTRWGSCGPDAHICLNWRLVCLPASIRDYVMVHELMHLRRLDHSPAYWALVAAACPKYKAARRWLREHGKRFR